MIFICHFNNNYNLLINMINDNTIVINNNIIDNDSNESHVQYNGVVINIYDISKLTIKYNGRIISFTQHFDLIKEYNNIKFLEKTNNICVNYKKKCLKCNKPITYICSHLYPQSDSNRIILIKYLIDNNLIGNIHICNGKGPITNSIDIWSYNITKILLDNGISTENPINIYKSLFDNLLGDKKRIICTDFLEYVHLILKYYPNVNDYKLEKILKQLINIILLWHYKNAGNIQKMKNMYTTCEILILRNNIFSVINLFVRNGIKLNFYFNTYKYLLYVSYKTGHSMQIDPLIYKLYRLIFSGNNIEKIMSEYNKAEIWLQIFGSNFRNNDIHLINKYIILTDCGYDSMFSLDNNIMIHNILSLKNKYIQFINSLNMVYHGLPNGKFTQISYFLKIFIDKTINDDHINILYENIKDNNQELAQYIEQKYKIINYFCNIGYNIKKNIMCNLDTIKLLSLIKKLVCTNLNVIIKYKIIPLYLLIY
jgi:hypothetical protein